MRELPLLDDILDHLDATAFTGLARSLVQFIAIQTDGPFWRFTGTHRDSLPR